MQDKEEALIETIVEHHKIPNPTSKQVPLFSDGTNQGSFYYSLKANFKRTQVAKQKGEKISRQSLQNEKSFKRIEKVLSFYPKTREDNKKKIIELCDMYAISIEKNVGLLNKAYYEIFAKIMYLIDNKISIIDNNGIANDIFFMADINMQNKYGISVTDLVSKYIVNSKRL